MDKWVKDMTSDNGKSLICINNLNVSSDDLERFFDIYNSRQNDINNFMAMAKGC